ncbi:methyltransferase domain-containing protein, partial [Gemmatimonadota bacterium]
MTLKRIHASIFSLPLILLLVPCSAYMQQVDDDASRRQAAEDFISLTETALRPVYAPLAQHIVTRFGLAGMEGVGIDVGGGPGHLALELARRTPRMRWINLDINPHFFPFFNQMAHSSGLASRVEAMQADVHKLPYDDASVRFVVSRGSFQFWTDINAAFSEILRVLAPGGTAYVGRGFSENLPPELARQVRQAQGGGPRYNVEQAAEDLYRAMREAGISDYTIHTPEPAGNREITYGIWLEFTKPFEDRGKPSNAETLGIFQMDTIVMVGEEPRDPVARPRTESPGLEPTTSTVTRAAIDRQGAKTVVDAMNYVPGAWVESRGRKVKQFFSIRGQRYPYPSYALDGAWQREFHELPYFFPAEDVERIEIMRSSSALLTGLSGMAGVVNIVPRRYRRTTTSLQAEYGSF